MVEGDVVQVIVVSERCARNGRALRRLMEMTVYVGEDVEDGMELNECRLLLQQ